MQKHHVQLAVAAFIVVLVIVYLLFAFHTQDGAMPKATGQTVPQVALTQIKSLYAKGSYRVSGAVSVPTPCYTLSSQVSTATSSIRIDLSSPVDTGVCLQVPTAETFSVSAVGSKGASIQVYLNGKLATTTS